MSFTCEITGNTFEGLGFILNTTEGQKIVSPEAIFGGDSAPSEKSHEGRQDERVEKLTARVEVLEAGLADTPTEPQTLTASTSSARTTTAKKSSTSKG